MARTAFADRLPLPESQWLAWLNDAVEDLGVGTSVDQLVRLAERSVGDYLSPALWLNYLSCAPDLPCLGVCQLYMF